MIISDLFKKGAEMIGALIVTFNPDLDVLLRNIQAIRQQVNRVLIVDNGSKNINEIRNMITQNNLSKLELVTLGTNRGIAYALNVGMNTFSTQKFEWVMTLDQDSIVASDTINKLKKTDEFTKSMTAILAPEFIDREQELLVSSHKNNENSSAAISVTERDDVITSGSLTSVSAWQMVRGFDDQLFIDMVDYDFNQRLLGLGYKIYQVRGVYFEHSLGEAVAKTILQKFLFIKNPADHSATRTYYGYRNRIIFIKRYQKFKTIKILKLLLSLRYTLIFTDTGKKLKYALKGYKDGMAYSEKRDDYFKQYLKLMKKERSENNSDL